MLLLSIFSPTSPFEIDVKALLMTNLQIYSIEINFSCPFWLTIYVLRYVKQSPYITFGADCWLQSCLSYTRALCWSGCIPWAWLLLSSAWQGTSITISEVREICTQVLRGNIVSTLHCDPKVLSYKLQQLFIVWWIQKLYFVSTISHAFIIN